MYCERTFHNNRQHIFYILVADKDKENNNADETEEWQKYQTMFKYVKINYSKAL